MTTKFLDNEKFALSKFYRRGVSHEKQRFWTIFLSALRPPPLKSENFTFIVVSLSLRGVGWRRRKKGKKDAQKVEFKSNFWPIVS